MELLREVERVYGNVFKNMPSMKGNVVEQPKPNKSASLKTAVPEVAERTTVDESSISGYKEVEKGLMKDKKGKHSEAMKLYEKGGELGNKAAFLNMGNCYMFGQGVSEDWKKGIEMYGKCGKIGDDELGWIRELSNDRYVCGKELDLVVCFFS